MKYIIIGLGNYGHVLAEELSALGHEIIGADISESRVDSIKDKVATAFVIDATDEQSLSVLPLNSVDIVIVAIGENFGASIRVVALLKQKKVPRIFARAIDAVHKAVLEAFELERILTPEEDAARSLVQLLDFGTNMEGFRIDQDYYVVKFTVPEKFVGYFVNELNLDEEFHLKMIGLKRANKITNCLGISLTELHVKNEHVYTKPVEEVYTLLGDTVYEGTGREIKVGSIADNRYYASVSFEETGDFNILLGQDGDKSISLTAEGGKVFFKMAGVKSDKVQFVSSAEKCRNAEIFVDGRTIEVYLNDGEDVGTRLFYNSNRQGIFCLNSEKDAQVKICEMKSIWK